MNERERQRSTLAIFYIISDAFVDRWRTAAEEQMVPRRGLYLSCKQLISHAN
ncbi:hypothetical protein [Tsuneonella deserti]|uniref:hypothetical protein n=1 Tax=Tsuneonella deserti TaxID=2035528 RepID=UPI0016679EB9|nr:hypothetical protein [Tsuneonella deserti]